MTVHTYGVAGGGSPFFGDAVATSSALPTGSVIGELRLVLDTQIMYEWNGTTWIIFSNPAAAVTSVTGTAPVVSSGGTTPAISMPVATSIANGYLSNTDWSTFNAKQPAGSYEVTTAKGAANGYAPLDAFAKVPIANLPSAIMEYKGAWSAATNTPTLIDGSGDVGDTYRVSAAGTQNLGSGPIAFLVGEFIIYNGSIWEQSPAADGVISVAGKQGIVTLSQDDLSDTIITTPVNDDMLFYNGTNWVNRQKYTSAGCVVAPTCIDNGGGSITINATEVSLWNNASFIGQPQRYVLTPITVTLTDNTFNYVVADYNSGSPILKVITNVALITESDVIPVFSIYRKGAELHIQPWDTLGRGLANKTHQSIVKTQRYRRESGLLLTEYGTRNVKVASGVLWLGANKIDTLDVFSDVDNITFYYHVASVYTASTVTQYNNTQYDNGTALVSLSPNRYAVNWVYRGVELDKHIYIVLGTGDYRLSEAQSSQPPVLPTDVAAHAILVGRIIVLNGASTAIEIDSAFETVFAGTPGNHNDLGGLQGGTTDEYYHLTAAQHTIATQAATSTLSGYLAPTDFNLFTNKNAWHGFENRTASTLVWTNAGPDRTLTITGTFTYFYYGTRVVVSSSPAVQITNTPGLWYFYFASNGTLTATQIFPPFDNGVIVATVYWNGTVGTVNDERHGYARNLSWHAWAHNTIGARYGSGLDLSTAGSAGTATFSVSTGTIYDEDIAFSTAAPTTSAVMWYQTAVTAPGYTTDNTLSTIPFKWNSGTSRVQYVNAAGPYTLADAGVNRYVNVWFYGTTGLTSPVYILVETIATATGGHTSAANARLIAPPSLGLLGLPAEMKILFRLVVKGDGVIQAAITADDYRNTTPLPAGGTASSTAASISFAPYDGITSGTVQGAIQELADERQIKMLTSAQAINFTAAADFVYLVDTTSTTISVQLPTPVLDMQFVIKDVGFNANVNNITLLRAAAESIEGVAASYVIDSAGATVRIISNGTDWFFV